MGHEAMKKLLKIALEVKAIVSSGYSVHPIMGEFKKWAFDDVISKPYEIAELSKTLRKVITGVS